MSNQSYELNIVSHHPKFSNKPLRKYYVDGIETVGAWGDEPFEVRFKNNTWQKVQVKLSLDGTDILTGKPADTEISKDMWVVGPYATLSLQAWPEDHNGGAAFVFTSAEKSVALHTHGDLSSRGIIAAAVFTEGHVEPSPPVIYQNHCNYPYYGYPNYWTPISISSGTIASYNTSGNVGSSLGGGGTFSSCSNSISSAGQNACSDSVMYSAAVPAAAAGSPSDTRERSTLESLVSVGAGEHVDQHISYVAGLIKPVFSDTVRVKYVWWDTLVEKLKSNNVPLPHASGFPGDKKKGIDLGSTPRVGNKQPAARRIEENYARF